MKKTTTCLFVFLFIISAGCDTASNSKQQEAWDTQNAPSLFNVSEMVRYNQIPTSARVTGENTPWSGSYWPSYVGGIANRWQVDESSSSYLEDHLDETLNREEFANLTYENSTILSPAEKYDYITGDASFSVFEHVKRSMRRYTDGEGKIPTWYGICDGWAAASFNELEPKCAVDHTIGDRTVNFTPSDIKALISYAYTKSRYKTNFMGSRCEEDTIIRENGRAVSSACRDTNPASFHLTVTDYIANRNESFVAEVTNSSEVWNHPVTEYNFKYSALRKVPKNRRNRARFRNIAPGTKYLVNVDLYLTYATETAPSTTAVDLLENYANYTYTLELDKNYFIIGGEWTSKKHPDFLWRPSTKPEGNAGGVDIELIRELIEKSHNCL